MKRLCNQWKQVLCCWLIVVGAALCVNLIGLQEVIAQAKDNRHVVVAYDISRQMWSMISAPKNRAYQVRRESLSRLNDIITEILFRAERVLPNVAKGDVIAHEGNLPRPLLRQNDFLTMFRFGTKLYPTEFVHYERPQISERIFKEKLPDPQKYWSSFRERQSPNTIPILRAFQLAKTYSTELLYFVIISHIGSTTIDAKSQAQLEIERIKYRDQLIFAFTVSNHITIRIYQITPIPESKASIVIIVEPTIDRVTRQQIVSSAKLKAPPGVTAPTLEKVTYQVLDRDRTLYKKAIATSPSLTWPTALPVEIPWEKLSDARQVTISMELQLRDPKQPQLIQQEVRYTLKLPERPQCEEDRDCPQSQYCVKNRCSEKPAAATTPPSDSKYPKTPAAAALTSSEAKAKQTDQGDPTSSTSGCNADNAILGIFILLIIGVLGFVLYKFGGGLFSGSGKVLDICLNYSGTYHRVKHTVSLEKGQTLPLYKDNAIHYDCGENGYALIWQPPHLLLQKPDGKQEDIAFYSSIELAHGTLMIEDAPVETESL
jgi:hypothetical protein